MRQERTGLSREDKVLLIRAGMILMMALAMVVCVLICPPVYADLNIQIFFDGGGCGGYGRPVFVQPPMYGGFDPYFQPPPRRYRPMPQGYYGQYGGGMAYSQEFERQLRRLERDQQYRLDQLDRERARRDAERAFRYNNGGW